MEQRSGQLHHATPPQPQPHDWTLTSKGLKLKNPDQAAQPIDLGSNPFSPIAAESSGWESTSIRSDRPPDPSLSNLASGLCDEAAPSTGSSPITSDSVTKTSATDRLAHPPDPPDTSSAYATSPGSPEIESPFLPNKFFNVTDEKDCNYLKKKALAGIIMGRPCPVEQCTLDPGGQL